MRKFIQLIAFGALCAFSFVSIATESEAAFGRTKPIYNVFDAPIVTYSDDSLSLDTVEDTIIQASRYKDWSVKKVAPGHLEAWILVRGRHMAKVDIHFTTEKYSITYKNSDVLLYDPVKQTIHRNYNKWVKLLENTINQRLATH